MEFLGTKKPSLGNKLKVKMKPKTKKKEKPKKFIGKGLKIVDEDTFSFGYKPPSESDDESVEDLPQIAGVVDERPVEVQAMESFSQSKWKRLDDDKRNSSRVESNGSSPVLRQRDSSDDMSPPRKKGLGDDRDISPPRRRERRDSGDISPPRKKGVRNDRDSSPPRRRERRNSDDISPPRKRGVRNDCDSSPPRRRERRNSDDISPPRRGGVPNDRDSSPPRRKKRRNSDDMSPPRRNERSPPRRRRNSDDMSPPRQRKQVNSPPRRRNNSSDTSPPRRTRKGTPSPPRRRRNSRDSSPPRRAPDGRRKDRDRNLARPEILDASDEDSKRKTTLDGKKAGLQKASALRDEMLDFRKRENEMFQLLPDEVTGRNAKAVVRDRRTEADIAKEEEKQRKEEERKAQYNKWGKGLKQVEEQESRVRSALHEMSKPLARYKNDGDLDDHLKQIDRDGDPMAEYLAAKRRKATGIPEKPKYNGPPPPPNRFNIPPGYRWDGVDRSNGYEKDWFNRINAKKALEEEAYKWSVEDL